MPCINLPLNPGVGPALDLGISSPASLVPQGQPKPPVVWFRAIADTGCSHTSIHSSVAQKCGLKVMSKGAARTPGGNVAVNIYHGDVWLRSLISWTSPFEWCFADHGILEMVNSNPDFDALLGMDILSQGIFTTNGGLKQASFCW
jgi:aspartyl protease